MVLDLGEEGVVLFEEKNYVAPVVADDAFVSLNASAKQALNLFKFSLATYHLPGPIHYSLKNYNLELFCYLVRKKTSLTVDLTPKPSVVITLLLAIVCFLN